MSPADHFEVLGLRRSPLVDEAALKQAYYDLNRQLHPDRHQTESAAAQEASLQQSAAVNDAYRTLRDPTERGLYWLTLHGETLGGNNNRVPPDLAALVFEVQEQLEEARAGSDLAPVRQARQEIEAQRESLRQRLAENFAQWDRGAADPRVLLADLKTILSALAYLTTLARDVDAVLEK